MLDNEPTATSTTSTTETPAASGTTAPRTRRRAAARPAGPPSTETTAPPKSASADSADKPAKKPVKKAATKKTAKKAVTKKTATTESDAAAESTADAPTKKTVKKTTKKAAKKSAAETEAAPPSLLFKAPDPVTVEKPAKKATKKSAASSNDDAGDSATTRVASDADGDDSDDGEGGTRRRRRRGGRGRKGKSSGDEGGSVESADDEESAADGDDSDDGGSGTTRRRRRRRRKGGGDGDGGEADPARTVVHVREPRKASDEISGVKGSTRLEAKKQRRREGREQGRRRPPILTESEFLARREAVDRVMVVRQQGDRTQIAVLEDDILVEHYVAQRSAATMVGNVYLAKVQNVLPSMEAAFVDVGRGRNAVLYAGEVNWDAAGLDGAPRRIEHAMKSGDSVLVQVTKDPIGHKGARLTAQVSLPGRYLVYVPDGSMTGISRKLPDTERSRLKAILKKIVPDDAGVIVRTAAEGASEEELQRDVTRLTAQWEAISKQTASANAPALLHEEPDLTVRVIRDVFNEDFSKLVVSGDEAWETVDAYVTHVAPDLSERLSKWTGTDDVFGSHRIDEQLLKALDRKVWLPSGGYLVIDSTEAMVVVDVNTGKFTGSGGNLEQTVTKNNIEAAEEVVRQLRLRDVGGIIVIDFIDMVLESNRELVLRRLVECLGRDRTKHQVAEVTSLGLVQMTRKRVGQGLLEAFSTTCEECGGRGRHVTLEPVESKKQPDGGGKRGEDRAPRRRRGKAAVSATAEVDPEVAAREAAARAALAKVAVATVGAAADHEPAPDSPPVEPAGPVEPAPPVEPADETASVPEPEPDATLV
ncbi:MAG: Rne/Rng family ribonuclease [Actinomycetia bacterium]|nr:Rne/Rng family ribonuclease [Actinomycetes bacterium]